MLLSTAYFPPVEYFAILARYSVVYLEAHENYVKQSYRNRCRILTANGVEDLRFPVVHDGAKLITEVKVDYKTPWVRQTEYAIDSAYYSSPFFEYYRDGVFGILDSHPGTLWDLNLRLIRFFCSKIGLSTDLRLTGDYVSASSAQAAPTAVSLRSTPPQAVPPLSVPRVAWAAGAACPEETLPLPGGGELPLRACTHGSGADACPGAPGRGEGAIAGGDLRESIHPKRAAVMATRPYWQVFREKFGFVPNLSVMDLLFNEGPESICYLK